MANALRLDGSGQASIADDPTFDWGDVDFRFKITPDVWTGTRQYLLAQDVALYLYLSENDRSAVAFISTDGSSVIAGGLTVAGEMDFLDPGDTIWFRYERDESSGVVQWSTSLDNSIWDTLATAFSPAAPGSSIFNSSNSFGFGPGFLGFIHAIELRNDGVLVASPDFSAQALGTTSFEDAQGNTWSLSGDAEIVEFFVSDPYVVGTASLSMPAPVLTLEGIVALFSDYQYGFDDLVLGHLRPIRIAQTEGLLDPPSIQDQDTERQDAHGVWAGRAYTSGRTWQFDVFASCVDDEEAHELLAQLELSYRYQQGFAPWYFQRPTYPLRYLMAQCRRRSFSADGDIAMGLLQGSVEMFAADPRAYSAELHATALTIPTGLNTIEGTVNNAGNAETGCVITIQGPATNPVITNEEDDNRGIRLDVVLTAPETLVIDTYARTVTLDGDDAYDLLRNDNEWWHLLPGDNTIVYTRTGGGANSPLVLEHRDAWL